MQIRKDDTNGCHYVPTGTTNPESQIHRWVTDPMAENFVMTEKVTLEFYTRSLNNDFSTGRACVFLYKRHEAGSPLVATDTMLTNTIGATAYWTYTPAKNNAWPQKWERIRLQMTFNGAPYTIPAGDRLGVALSVERANTPADALAFMYDHPDVPDPDRGRHQHSDRRGVGVAPALVLAFFGGLVAGSFVTVVGYRVPRGESIVGPRSRCTACGAQIAAYDNVPVFSWALLRGRTRCCGERISPRYPLTELALGALYAATVAVLWDDPTEVALGLVFVTTLVAITLTDLERRVIPNRILIVAALAGLAIAAIGDPSSLPERAIAAAAAGGGLFLVVARLPARDGPRRRQAGRRHGPLSSGATWRRRSWSPSSPARSSAWP